MIDDLTDAFGIGYRGATELLYIQSHGQQDISGSAGTPCDIDICSLPVDFADMGTDKRARQKANRQARLAELEAEEAKEHREQSTRKFGKIAAVIGGIIALVVLWNIFTGGDDDDSVAEFAPTAVPETDSGPAEVVLADSVPDDFAPFSGDRALTLVEPAARNGVYDVAPAMNIDTTKTYIAVFDTSEGEISVELYPEASPITVNNFINLARDGFYDGTVFHRVLEGFMAQGGDPTGSGTGGPGYQFEDEVDNGLAFDKTGLLAMANAGPGTNGSQFFITFDVQATSQLTGRHTIFGEVVRNEEALADIVRVDPSNPSDDQAPLTVLESVRIIES